MGDAFGEQLLAQPATSLKRMQLREVMPGMWPYSDDTVMAMSIVETLHHHGRIEQDGLAGRFARKYQLDPTRGYGTMAHMVLADIARGRQWRQAAGAAFGGKGSMGNGGAMRAAPIGVYFAGDLPTAAAEARLSAEITHAHLEGQAGAVAVAAAAAWVAARPSETTGLFPAVLDVMPAGETRNAIEKAAALVPARTWITSSICSATAYGSSRRTLCRSHCGARATTRTITRARCGRRYPASATVTRCARSSAASWRCTQGSTGSPRSGGNTGSPCRPC